MQTASRFLSTDPARVSARSEAAFFGALKTANNTFKSTATGRLATIDQAIIRRLDAAGAQPRRVLDLGISSGVTTLELAQALWRSGRPVAVTGTDRSMTGYLVDLPWGCRALVEPGGHILQYDLRGVPLRPWNRRLDYVTGMALVRRLVDRQLAPRARARLGVRRACSPVPLVSPRLARAGGVELVEDDIAVANCRFAGRFELIRAANILNRHYFSDAGLEAAVCNVRSYLAGAGSWLAVVRTHGGGDHRGTLFRMNDAGGLDPVERWGGGSEVEAEFLSAPVSSGGATR
ncbi:hypothetical protein [Sphingomonas trueperi]|uniref:hypothetical protein n=1 Tax=Sphingomonas trueperi TaxID=53317 RepID=UPI000EB17377